MEVYDRELLLNSQVISPDTIDRQFNSLTRVIQDLAKEALLTRVEFSMSGEICKLRDHHKPNKTECDEREWIHRMTWLPLLQTVF